jgi:hypothetical protein
MGRQSYLTIPGRCDLNPPGHDGTDAIENVGAVDRQNQFGPRQTPTRFQIARRETLTRPQFDAREFVTGL